jgi:hypothetical protein
MRRRIATSVLLVMLVSPASTLPAVATETDEPPPYTRHHFELVDLPLDHLSFTNELPPGLPPGKAATPQGIPLVRWRDGRLYVHPVALAINSLKRLDAYRDTGDRRQLEQALVQARYMRRTRIERAGAWWLPFWFDYQPESLKAPWFDAMSQGLSLSFFVRLYRVTGDEAHRQAADGIFASFRRLGPRQQDAVRVPQRAWVAYVDERDNLWLEHYPRIDPDHVLNVHLHAINGLYEYWQLTRSPEARQLLEGALTTMRERAGQYRRLGRVSVYGMRTRTNHFHYHEVHVWQLRLLGRMTGDPWFTRLGIAMASDAPPVGHVPGRPAVRSVAPSLSTAPRQRQMAHYPPVRPALERAA